MTQYARFTTTDPAPMFDPNVVERALAYIQERRRMTREEALALLEKDCGRYVRGAHKGALRGYLSVTYCREGGWVSQGSTTYGAEGYVAYPGTIRKVSICGYTGEELIEA